MDTFLYVHDLTKDLTTKLIISLIFAIPYIWSITWSYKDAKRRGKPPVLVALLIALFSWPLSILLWIVFRPNHK